MRWIALSLVLSSFMASSAWGKGDPELGKQKALLCSGCHGVDGRSPQATTPKLSGQLAVYIVAETRKFQKGTRKDPMMSSISAILKNDQDLEDIAAYYASLPVMTGSVQDRSLSNYGQSLFSRERCDFCHGDSGKHGPPTVGGAPIIGGQHKAYLQKALIDIKNGARPADIYGLMKKTLSQLSDEEIEALAEFLSGL